MKAAIIRSGDVSLFIGVMLIMIAGATGAYTQSESNRRIIEFIRLSGIAIYDKVNSQDMLVHQIGVADVTNRFTKDGVVHRFNDHIDQYGVYRVDDNKLCLRYGKRMENCYFVQYGGADRYTLRDANLPREFPGIPIIFVTRN